MKSAPTVLKMGYLSVGYVLLCGFPQPQQPGFPRNWLRAGNRPATALLDRLIEVEDMALTPVVLRDLPQGAVEKTNRKWMAGSILTRPGV